ncbi:MAG TPA: tetratricopeptide repeat protein [Thermoanaerobaculia bacterium]|nr:tetratricopeptide repeat protein [Thermoanaerobaculia bacterium]
MASAQPRGSPAVYQINTWAWLRRLGFEARQRMTLRTVPYAALMGLAELGFDAIWLMGVWQRSPSGRKIAQRDPALQSEYRRALPDFTPEDVVGSPYAIFGYQVDPALGTEEDLDSLRCRLRRLGMLLILDFVGNHLGRDHPWIESHPERFVQGSQNSLHEQPESYFAADTGGVFAHGRDPYFSAWTDTVQLDHRRLETRRAMIDTLQAVASRCDGVRCDMAMLLIHDSFLRTWGGQFEAPGSEFWSEAIEKVKDRQPDFMMIAEAYWGLEAKLQELGFDYTYDKGLYDRLLNDDAPAVRAHLRANLDYQRRLVRFVENHDEQRAASAFGDQDRSLAAATLALNLPGMRLYHDGQMEGLRTRLPVQLGRRQAEPTDARAERFHRRLLQEQRHRVFHEGDWLQIEPRTARAEDHGHEGVVAFQWTMGEERRLIAVNLSSRPARCRLPLELSAPAGPSWRFRDLLGDTELTRCGEDVAAHGLELDLAARAHHLFACEPVRAAIGAYVPATGTRILRVVVASPGDVIEEHRMLDGVFDELNQSVAADRGLVLIRSWWQTDAHAGFHPEGPQGLIDRVLRIEDCDIFIGVFWTRFGTPVSDAGSGTEHEIRRAFAAWKANQRPQIMIFFNEAPSRPKSSEEAEQLRLVLKLKEGFPAEGLFWQYEGADQFERCVRKNLINYIRHQFELLQHTSAPSVPNPEGEIGTEPNLYIPRPEVEARILIHLLKAPDGSGSRLVTLHGAGGMGKSRLAMACGRQATASFRGDVFAVSLDGKARSAGAVAEAIGIVLGIKGGDGLRGRLLSYLHDRRLLLILDNYESVASQEVASFLGEILAKTLKVHLLVTGRVPVNLAGVEQVIHLDEGMTEPEARELFLARARLRREGDWKLSADQEADLRRIIDQTAQIPLAIEFAAAWVGQRSLRQIANQLAEQGGVEPPPSLIQLNPRHASLWKCQDWSFGLLDDPAKKGFVGLGIFPETFTAEAATWVCSRSDAQPLIDQLHDFALVRQQLDVDPLRYRMHRFTQEYAYQRLRADGSFPALRQRFIDFFSRRSRENTERAERSGAAPSEILTMLDWTEVEWRNLYAAAERAAQDGNWSAVVALSRSMVYFFQRRGHLQDGEELYKRLLDLVLSSAAPAPEAAGTIRNALGVICQFRRGLQSAERFFLDSLQDRSGIERAKTLNSLGTIYQGQRRWPEAKVRHEESREICRTFSDRSEEARALYNLGMVYELLGEPARADEALQQSLHIWREELGDAVGESETLNSLGGVYQHREEWPRARQAFEARLAKVERMGDLVGQARALNSLGYVCRREGRLEEAEKHYRLALAVCGAVKDSVEEGEVHRNLGELFEQRGRVREAAESFERSWPLRQGTERARTCNSLGWLYELQGSYSAAEDCYRRALTISREVCDYAEEETSLRNLGRVQAALGK